MKLKLPIVGAIALIFFSSIFVYSQENPIAKTINGTLIFSNEDIGQFHCHPELLFVAVSFNKRPPPPTIIPLLLLLIDDMISESHRCLTCFLSHLNPEPRPPLLSFRLRRKALRHIELLEILLLDHP